MAEESKVEEIKEGEAQEKKKGSSPWIPLAVVIILLPVLSYVITDFVLIPKIKQSIHKTITGATASASTEETHASSKDKKASKVPGMTSFEFKNIVANLSGAMQSRYIKVSFIVESPEPNFVQLMDENQVKIKDVTLTMLSSLTINDLEKPGVQGKYAQTY